MRHVRESLWNHTLSLFFYPFYVVNVHVFYFILFFQILTVKTITVLDPMVVTTQEGHTSCERHNNWSQHLEIEYMNFSSYVQIISMMWNSNKNLPLFAKQNYLQSAVKSTNKKSSSFFIFLLLHHSDPATVSSRYLFIFILFFRFFFLFIIFSTTPQNSFFFFSSFGESLDMAALISWSGEYARMKPIISTLIVVRRGLDGPIT